MSSLISDDTCVSLSPAVSPSLLAWRKKVEDLIHEMRELELDLLKTPITDLGEAYLLTEQITSKCKALNVLMVRGPSFEERH